MCASEGLPGLEVRRAVRRTTAVATKAGGESLLILTLPPE